MQNANIQSSSKIGHSSVNASALKSHYFQMVGKFQDQSSLGLQKQETEIPRLINPLMRNSEQDKRCNQGSQVTSNPKAKISQKQRRKDIRRLFNSSAINEDNDFVIN